MSITVSTNPKVNTVIVVNKQPSVIQENTGVTSLAEFADTQITSPVNDQALVYRDGKWKNIDVAEVNADANVEFNQSTASAFWTINHNLNKYPSVIVIDSVGDEIEGDVSYVNKNTITITFSAAFSGKAYLN